MDHYMKCYLSHNNLLPDPLSVLPDTFQGNHALCPSSVETFNDDQVPPYSSFSPFTRSYTGPGSDISGYNPLRDDYDVEYDNDAEMMLKDVEILGDEDEKEKELKTCMLRAFNRTCDVLIIKRSLNARRSFARARETEEVRGGTWPSGPEEHSKRRKEEAQSSADFRHHPQVEQDIFNLMKPFARFLSKKDYDLMMNGLIKEAKLRERIARLQRYRKSGIRTLEEAERFEKDGTKKEDDK